MCGHHHPIIPTLWTPPRTCGTSIIGHLPRIKFTCVINLISQVYLVSLNMCAPLPRGEWVVGRISATGNTRLERARLARDNFPRMARHVPCPYALRAHPGGAHGTP